MAFSFPSSAACKQKTFQTVHVVSSFFSGQTNTMAIHPASQMEILSLIGPVQIFKKKYLWSAAYDYSMFIVCILDFACKCDHGVLPCVTLVGEQACSLCCSLVER